MLKQLTLRNFRNLRELDWNPGTGGHLLLGANGAGKTSILEAVYVLATTRSFRTSRLVECRRHGTSGFFLSGEIEREARWHLEVADSETGRHRRVNGDTRGLADHLAALPVLSWSEADQGLITGGPESRRRFVDRGILGERPAALEVLGRYRKTLGQKRALLARAEGGSLDAWNRLLARSGAELVALRSRVVDELSKTFHALREAAELDLPPVELRYRPSPPEALGGEEPFFERLARMREREIATRRVLVGPHRDEIAVLWPESEVRRQASAGERKAIGLTLLAAQAKHLAKAGREPLLLLDDLDTELDERRLGLVWGLFNDFRQLFVSSNRPVVWQSLGELRTWRVAGGCLDALTNP